MRYSVSIFCVAVALVLIACGSKQQAAPPPTPVPAAPAFTTVDTIKDLMDSIIDPNADILWGAIGENDTPKGLIKFGPKTDDDWTQLRYHAVTVLEATNLLLVPDRPVAHPGEKADDPDVEMTPEQITAKINSDRATFYTGVMNLRKTALATVEAIDKKDANAVVDATDTMDKACESCHLNYWYPNDKVAHELYEQDLADAAKQKASQAASAPATPAQGK